MDGTAFPLCASSPPFGLMLNAQKNTAEIRGVFYASALLLLVLGILANHHNMALALDALALLADRFYGRSYLHRLFLLSGFTACFAR